MKATTYLRGFDLPATCKIILSVIFISGITACYPFAMIPSKFPTVTEVFHSPIKGFGGDELSDYVLLPDGESIIDYYAKKIELRSGSISRPFSGDDLFDLGNLLRISPDGKYISGIKTTVNDGEPIRMDYVLNIETQAITPYQINGGIPAISWSPDSSRFLLSDMNSLVSLSDAYSGEFVH